MTSASHGPVRELLRGPLDVTVKQDGLDELVPQCDLMITKSGTGTAHVVA